MNRLRPEKYLRYLYLPNLFSSNRTKEILSVNPTVIPSREEAAEVRISIYDYNAEKIEIQDVSDIRSCNAYKENGNTTWINIDGLRKTDVETVCAYFNIHPLIIEDILSSGQRPKMEETDNGIFCLLNMLYYNEEKKSVEQEQISLLLIKDIVISFQEDATRDVFNSLREKIKSPGSKIRQRTADYLCYSLLDHIVDHYFIVMEKLGQHTEDLEEDVSHGTTSGVLPYITRLRKELIILKRNFVPVRELVNGFLRSDSDLLEDRHTKYYKDVYDHIVQAIDLLENYRDIIVSMQDLHINNVNLKLNEVMKVMAIVTCLLAPATVIGGIFGMNFDNNVNFFHQKWGFYLAVSMMFVIPVGMLWAFRKRGWF